MKKYALLIIAAITLLSCSGHKQQTEATVTNDTQTVKAPDMHNAENSLDYWGVYEGTLPAADCPGIQTTLTLNKDNTFTLHSEYIDRKDAIFDEKGTYTIEGNIITSKQEDGTTNYYKVEEGQVRMLDMDKQPIDGDMAESYILKRTKTL